MTGGLKDSLLELISGDPQQWVRWRLPVQGSSRQHHCWGSCLSRDRGEMHEVGWIGLGSCPMCACAAVKPEGCKDTWEESQGRNVGHSSSGLGSGYPWENDVYVSCGGCLSFMPVALFPHLAGSEMDPSLSSTWADYCSASGWRWFLIWNTFQLSFGKRKSLFVGIWVVTPVNTALSTSLSLICISHATLNGLKLNMPDSCRVMQKRMPFLCLLSQEGQEQGWHLLVNSFPYFGYFAVALSSFLFLLKQLIYFRAYLLLK